MKDKIKNCPFCNGKAHIIKGERGYAIGCLITVCWAWLPKDAKKSELENYSGGLFINKSNAIEAWNRRVL